MAAIPFLVSFRCSGCEDPLSSGTAHPVHQLRGLWMGDRRAAVLSEANQEVWL